MENKIINAINQGSSHEVESLLKQGVNVDFVNYQTGNSFLHLAIEKDNEAIVKVLIDNKVNLEMRNIKGMTPLHVAMGYRGHGALNINPNIVRLLLHAGAFVDALDKEGRSPLFKVAGLITRNTHVASSGGNSVGNITQAREVMKLLLENGASILAGKDQNHIPAIYECVHTVLAEMKFEQAIQKLQKQFEQQMQEMDIVEPENQEEKIDLSTIKTFFNAARKEDTDKVIFEFDRKSFESFERKNCCIQ